MEFLGIRNGAHGFVMSAFLLCAFVIVRPCNGHETLHVGFYNMTCPQAEDIVREIVHSTVLINPGIIPGLIRLHFHDCFVQGCDASILLDSTPTGEPVEKTSLANGKTLHGLNVLDAAKLRLELACPGTVSCADVLAFAARDAAVLAGLLSYSVLSGRRDGRISRASDIPFNLPAPFYTVDTLTATFAKKGFTQEEMVTLSGAHSIGSSHCSSFANRLHNFSAVQAQDPSIDPVYAEYLRLACPAPGSFAAVFARESTVKLDSLSSYKLDNLYYVGLQMGRGLLGSDQALVSDPNTKKVVEWMAGNPMGWAKKFGAAMQKVGNVDVLTGEEGEVRRSCRSVN